MENYEITPGKKEGFIDVTFGAKPNEEVRNQMKAAKFRWSPRFQCWYGQALNFPLGEVDAASVATKEGVATTTTYAPTPPVTVSQDEVAAAIQKIQDADENVTLVKPSSNNGNIVNLG